MVKSSREFFIYFLRAVKFCFLIIDFFFAHEKALSGNNNLLVSCKVVHTYPTHTHTHTLPVMHKLSQSQKKKKKTTLREKKDDAGLNLARLYPLPAAAAGAVRHAGISRREYCVSRAGERKRGGKTAMIRVGEEQEGPSKGC